MTGPRRRTLITGATGQVGSAVIRSLAGSDLDVVAGGRSEERARALGVPWVRLDYDEPSTLGPALDGIDTVFMVTDYSVAMFRHSKAFINAAKRADVKHIVHLGAPGDDDTDVDHWGWHQFIERYIAWSGIGFTHLRPEIFMQNLLGYGGSKPVAAGVIRHYVGTVKQSWVDVDDIAAMAAACLIDPARHAGATSRLGYDVKSYDEIAAILTTEVGQPFRYEARPPAEFLEKVLAAGADHAYMRCAYANYLAYTEGRRLGSDYAVDNFTAIVGRPPSSWSDFAARRSAAFAY